MTGFPQTTRSNSVWMTLLGQIAHESQAQVVCLFVCLGREDQRGQLVAHYTQADYPSVPEHQLAALLSPVTGHLGDKTVYLNQQQLAGSDFASGMLIALRDDTDRLFGSVALLFTHVKPAQRPKGISVWLKLLRTTLENAALRDERRMGDALQNVLMDVENNRSPRQVFESLNRSGFFGQHITFYGLLFRGFQTNPSSKSYEYLETDVLWDRENGFSEGQGLRIYLRENEALSARLESHRTVLMGIDDVMEEADPLVQGLLSLYNLKYLLFVNLYSNNQDLGLLGIGSEFGFSELEINILGSLGDFIAINHTIQHIEKQRDSIERSRATLINAVTDGVLFVVPHESEQSGKILTVNQSFCDMFNINAERVQDITLVELVNRMQIRKEAREKLGNAWTTFPISYPFAQTGEFETLHPEGYSVTLEWYSSPVLQHKTLIGRIYTFRDVSQSRVAARLRADFVRRLAHEMRTPLTSIQGFAELLRNSLEATSTQSDYLKLITQSASHLNTIVSQMIEGARAESGEFELVLSSVNLLDIAHAAVSLVKPTPESRQQKVTITTQGSFKAIQIDSNLILRVFHQLLDNACKFSPPGSHIRLYITLIGSADKRVDAIPPDTITPAILVEVADEGAGVATDDLSLIFLPFYRSQEARALQAPGSGLGLTIARGIVEAHRGKLWADKRRRGRKGGRFYFTLPYDA